MVDDDPTRTKYLIPINFGPKSEQALEFALTYALGQGQIPEIFLFHVVEDAVRDFRLIDRANEEIMDRMKKVFVNTSGRLQKQGIIPNVEDVHRRLDHGKAGAKILEMATGLQPDILVMGTPTSGGFKKLIKKAPCTLVLVKDKEHLQS